MQQRQLVVINKSGYYSMHDNTASQLQCRLRLETHQSTRRGGDYGPRPRSGERCTFRAQVPVQITEHSVKSQRRDEFEIY